MVAHCFRRHQSIALLLFAMLFALCTNPAHPATNSESSITGLVVAVSDGDTITVLDSQHTQHRIRLMGIDAPEKAQPFGQRSKHSLSELIFGKEVVIEGNKRDRYGRTIGKVVFENTDICLEQIRRGMAWHYKQYEREQLRPDRATYAEAETNARNQKIGLWADPAPVPPWLFRHPSKTSGP